MANATLQYFTIILLSCVSQSLGYVIFNIQKANISSQPTTQIYNGFFTDIAIEIILDQTLQQAQNLSLVVWCSGKILIDTYNTKLNRTKAFFLIPDDCKQPMTQFQIYALGQIEFQQYLSVGAQIQWKGESEPGLKICPFNCNNNGSCNQSTGLCQCNDFYSGYDCSYGYTQVSTQSNVDVFLGNYFIQNKEIQFFKLFSNQKQNQGFCNLNVHENFQIFIAPVNDIQIKNYNQALQSIHEPLKYFEDNLIVLYTEQANSSFEIYIGCSSEQQVIINLNNFMIIVFTVLPIIIFLIVIIQIKYIKKKPQQHLSYFEQIKYILQTQGEEKKMTFEQFIKEDFAFKEIKQCSKCFKEFNPNEKVILTKFYQLIHDESQFECHYNKRFSTQPTEILKLLNQNNQVDNQGQKNNMNQIKDMSIQQNITNLPKEHEQPSQKMFFNFSQEKDKKLEKQQSRNTQNNQDITSDKQLKKSSRQKILQNKEIFLK
ncbi:hypothetical protein ABPG72_018005 [Tetrahymena utriculariae]